MTPAKLALAKMVPLASTMVPDSLVYALQDILV